MHCNICDKEMSEKEISFSKELNTFEPCSICLEVIMDAAYSDGFKTEDDEYIIIEESEELTDLMYSSNSGADSKEDE